jgi:phage baseplate assembly protein W
MATDLQLTHRLLGEQASDRMSVDLADDERGGLQLASGRANLAQSVLSRLLTRQGELAGLGHPNYGSRLYQLIGEPHTRRTQTLANLYIRESLAAEKGIQEIVAITFAPPSLRADKRNVLEVTIVIRPADTEELLTIAVTLGG